MAVVNKPTITDNEKVNINRAQAEHRGTWMALMFDEMRKAGLDAETITRKAIDRTGHFHGVNWKAQVANPDDVREFDAAFFNELGKGTFEIKTESNPNEVRAEFHYCPLLAAWQKQGFDDETLAKLCDLAMQGDRAIAAEMGYNLDIEQTIAEGCPTCMLHVYKK